VDVDAVLIGLTDVRGGHGVLDKPREDVSDRRLAGFESEEARNDPILDNSAHTFDRHRPVVPLFERHSALSQSSSALLHTTETLSVRRTKLVA